jgi:hypothetical protein
MRVPNLHDIALLHKVVRLDIDTGDLFWRFDIPRSLFYTDASWLAWCRQYGGKPAFTSDSHGYKHGTFLNERYRAHRVVWALFHNRWPKRSHQIDHINGVRSDNRPSNLREVTQGDNARNMKARPDSISGVAGVVWVERSCVWRAYLAVNKTNICLGTFLKHADAVAARTAAQLMHGYTPDHGKRGWEGTSEQLREIERLDLVAAYRDVHRVVPLAVKVRGVKWHKGSQRWVASIAIDGVRTTLGYYASRDEAIAVRYKAGVDKGNHVHPMHSAAVGAAEGALLLAEAESLAELRAEKKRLATRGVTWSKEAGKYCAYAIISGKMVHLSNFSHLDDAMAAAAEARSMPDAVPLLIELGYPSGSRPYKRKVNCS